jgi:methyl-accepting chemotaxis protein
MNGVSLKIKILLLVISISLISPIISGIIIFQNSKTNTQYQTIADKSLPRTRKMGEVLFNFRQVRIQFRSLALRNNSPKDFQTYLDRINESVAAFNESLNELTEMMSVNAEEIKMSDEVKTGWNEFAAFGQELLALQKIGDEESYNKMAELIKHTCPKTSQKFEEAVNTMITWQDKKAIWRTETAKANTNFTNTLSVCLAALGVIVSVIIGYFFTASLVKNLTMSMESLKKSSGEILSKSEDVSEISIKLSQAANEQAASIQETVSSIDEISAMVSKNSDSAGSSSKASIESTKAVMRGKENVKLMIDSISAITETNLQVIHQVSHSNQEISQIVELINNISLKTQVINDIVFQTKLLSFNASVEAARAGENGKGFAVVAEEVGNLASMSGKASAEITEMVSSSVSKVRSIVESSKAQIEGVVKQSKVKIEMGSATAKECEKSLEEILVNVSTVNDLVQEIAVASKEQAVGVSEINKAMSQLDEVTQANSFSAKASSEASSELKLQVENLDLVVQQIMKVVEGK